MTFSLCSSLQGIDVSMNIHPRTTGGGRKLRLMCLDKASILGIMNMKLTLFTFNYFIVENKY